MRALRGIAARLGAVALIAAASLPGHLQLVHRHAGDEHAHVHADAESLAARDLLEQHGQDPFAHTHPHPHPHPADEDGHGPAGEAPHDGPELWAVTSYHVHGLHAFQQATRATESPRTASVAVARVETPAPSAPRLRARRAARPRGPPILLVA